MKLYTEEQVRRAIELARDTHQEGKPYLERDEYDYSEDEVVNLLTPIQLPTQSDLDEILHNSLDDHAWGYIRAIEHLEEQIKSTNNQLL